MGPLTLATADGSALLLDADADQVTLRAGSPPVESRCTVDELLGGHLDEAITRALDLRALVESIARLTLRRRGETVRAPSAADAGRPSVAHCYEFGRGVPKAAWLMGREVWVHAAGRRFEASLDELLARGFPPDIAADLGEDVVRTISDAVARLNPLPCLCDTGALTPQEHGTLDEIARRQHPFAPIDVQCVVGRCRVCRLGWTFESAGDSHYSYRYDAHPFLPWP
jgi:hypothetical protein